MALRLFTLPQNLPACVAADADAAAAGAEPRSIAGTDFRCRGVSWGTGANLAVDEVECRPRFSMHAAGLLTLRVCVT